MSVVLFRFAGPKLTAPGSFQQVKSSALQFLLEGSQATSYCSNTLQLCDIALRKRSRLRGFLPKRSTMSPDNTLVVRDAGKLSSALGEEQPAIYFSWRNLSTKPDI